MEIKMNLSEIKSREFISWFSEVLYNTEYMFIADENTIINTGSDCGDHIYTIIPQDAIAFSKDYNFKSHIPAETDGELNAVILDIDEKSGKSNSIERIYIKPE